MPKDYYVVLGVSKGVDLRKIKKAYRAVVKKYHPDTAPPMEDVKKLLEAKEAYEILSDEKRRKKYDEELAREGSLLRISKAPDLIQKRKSIFNEIDKYTSSIDEFLSGFVPGYFPDFFEKGRGKGKNLYLEVVLSMREATEGGLFPLKVPVIEPCPRCSKSGFWEDFFCPLCLGRGRVRFEKEFSLSIPPHVRHGTEVRLSMEDIGLKDVYLNVIVHIDPRTEQEQLWEIP
jgi:molecular chaperone DnaJ